MTNFKIIMQCLSRVAFLGLMLVSANAMAWGHAAPALRVVMPATAAPEAMSQLFADLGDGEKTISIPGAAWLQLQFADVKIGSDGVLTIAGSSGESQNFTQSQIDAWGGLTAVFNGSKLLVGLKQGAGATEHVSATIKDIIIGLPGSVATGAEVVIPQSLLDLLGPDIKRFIPNDLHGSQTELVQPSQGVHSEAICGRTDDRIVSANPRVGRVMPVGCTSWLIDGGNLLSAGHCINQNFQTVEFNVPASLADGTTQAPFIRDQYRVRAGSIVSQNGGTGNDWAVFQVLSNTETGLMPANAQGAVFEISNTDNPTQVRITGYGLDGPAPDFGDGDRNAQSQTQQTHSGRLAQNTADGVLRYDPDTQRGNSGSPVAVEDRNVAIGIHTDGGCGPNGGSNAGTSFRNAALWRAIADMPNNPVPSNWQVALSDGTKFTHAGVWSTGWATGEYWHPFVADVNDDQKADLIVWAPGDAAHPSSWQVALSDGTKFTHAGVWSTGWATGEYWRPFVADVNGDGKADLVVWSPGDAAHPSSWQVALSDGTKFTHAGVWSTGWATGEYWRPFVVNVNKDKSADLVVWFSGRP